jgi:hypothetical protein
MAEGIKPELAKFKELILYVAQKSESDPYYGAVKLNKILFFSDFLAYGKLGHPITGETYRKRQYGPAPTDLLQIREQMIEAKEAAMKRRDHFGNMQERLEALREPDLSLFGGAEIAIVDEVLEQLRGKNATEVSELSHRFSGWQDAQDDEIIPYQTVFISDRAFSESELRHASTIKPTHPAD